MIRDGWGAPLLWAGALFCATALYMACAYRMLPDAMPMQWNGQNLPTWYASRQTFAVWMAMLLVGLNALFLLAPGGILRPGLVGVNLWMLLLYHMIYQQVAAQKFLFVPVNVGTVVLVFGALISVALWIPRIRR